MTLFDRLFRRDARKRGWHVSRLGRDQMLYEEFADRTTRHITIDGEMLVGRPRHVIYFASPDEWRQRYPDWARDRRDEIIARIKSELRQPDYEYSGI
jgi:hypothetical protein